MLHVWLLLATANDLVCACRRKKLPLLSVAQLDALLGPAGPQDVLIAVCVLASWNPVCTKLEHYQLQAAAYELQQQAAAAKHVHGGGGGALQHGSSRDGSGSSCSSSVALGADAAYVQVTSGHAFSSFGRM